MRLGTTIKMQIACELYLRRTHAQCQQCWLKCSNDPTFHPTFENNGIAGYRHPTLLTRIKLHPTSEMSLLGDPTWCSNYPTFHTTSIWVNVGRNVGSFKQAYRVKLPLTHYVYHRTKSLLHSCSVYAFTAI